MVRPPLRFPTDSRQPEVVFETRRPTTSTDEPVIDPRAAASTQEGSDSGLDNSIPEQLAQVQEDTTTSAPTTETTAVLSNKAEEAQYAAQRAQLAFQTMDFMQAPLQEDKSALNMIAEATDTDVNE